MRIRQGLERFLDIQDRENFMPGITNWQSALDEIRSGRKTGHWMWYIFPQMRGLGYSPESQYYGLSGADEAQTYAAHPMLGARLREIAGALLALPPTPPEQIFGRDDTLKLRSCMTLFRRAVPEEPVFAQVLQRYYGGRECVRTLEMCGWLPEMERWVRPAFAVIGMEGSSEDGADFVQRLWNDANGRFGEVEPLAKRDVHGNLSGVWGLMTDFSRSFLPWEENFTRGLYLAGVECRADAQPPEGWTRWEAPGFEYLRVRSGPDVFPVMIDYLRSKGIPLAGAVQDYTDPADGSSYMCFPVRRLPSGEMSDKGC